MPAFVVKQHGHARFHQDPANGWRREQVAASLTDATILTTMRVSRSLPFAVAAGLLASGCVIVPVTTEGYDADCRVVTHHVELQTVQVAELRQCANQGCAAVVLAGLGVTAVSGIVSGSIAVIGNVAYWAERRASCSPLSPDEQR